MAVNGISGPVTERAVYEILSQGAAMSQTMTPVDTSNLINSQTAPQISRSANGIEGSIGYTAEYAAAVHEAPGKLAGQPRDENDPSRGDFWDPNAEPGFLEKGFDEIASSIPAILRRNYRV